MVTALASKIPAFFDNNNERLVREFNETFILSNSVGRLKLLFKGTGILDNSAELHFVFTDDLAENKKPLSSDFTTNENGNLLIMTYYQWYGLSVESPNPFKISDDEKKNTWYIQLTTTADKQPPRRTVTISIWRIL